MADWSRRDLLIPTSTYHKYLVMEMKLRRNICLIKNHIEKCCLQQYLNYGTTTILDLGQPEKWLDVTTQWQKNNSSEFPNLYNAGGALISDYDWLPNMNHAEILNKEHAKEKIKGYTAKGIKHLKLYSYLNEVDLKNVISVAEKQGITVTGHLDRGEVNVDRAMELGVVNFEHFFYSGQWRADYLRALGRI